MAEDFVTIAAASAPAAVGYQPNIKTFTNKDANGLLVEVQAVCMTDEFGRTVGPMSEATGREILEQLRLLNALLAGSQDSIQPLG